MRTLGLLACVIVTAACNGSRPPPQVEGGCRYVAHQGRCRFVTTTVAAADSDDPGIVTVQARYEWQGPLPQPAFQRELTAAWTVPRTSADAAAAWAQQHAEIACVLSVDSGGCPPDGPHPAPDALPPPPTAP